MLMSKIDSKVPKFLNDFKDRIICRKLHGNQETTIIIAEVT